MILENLKVAQPVNFEQAITLGLGKEQGLFFPSNLAKLDNVDELLEMDFVARSSHILHHILEDEIPLNEVTELVEEAFQFAAPLKHVKEDIHCLELFHGPTLAFKDFGGRFMAQCLSRQLKKDKSDKKITIVTATSGDTGAAVAHAFHGIENIEVVILYPKGKISLLQEKMFCTLGGNIKTIAIEAAFDDCQSIVKQVFQDDELNAQLNLNSANSINIARLMAQICYYFEALAQLPKEQRAQAVISVPSGNFGNLTAGMMAQVLGLPIKRFIAATNSNDTVPRYWKSGEWQPNETIPTMSNAMDVSEPNNWPRIEAMFEKGLVDKACLTAVGVDEETTQIGVKELYSKGYLSEPHAAIAYKAVKHGLEEGEVGIFLGTAHPAKFKDVVENILGELISLPKELADCAAEQLLSIDLPNEYDAVKAKLLESDFAKQ